MDVRDLFVRALIWCRRGPGLGADQVADAPADFCMTVGV